MGRMMGLEPTNTGITIRGLNHLATPATILKLYKMTEIVTSLHFVSFLTMTVLFIQKSGRRDSNARQSAWKADTLPTELHPRNFLNCF